jgi:hypothetical protein
MTMMAERSRQTPPPPPARDEASAFRSRSKYVAAVAAAAGILAALGVSRLQEKPQVPIVANIPNVGTTRDFDELLEDLVSLHARPLPPETTNPEDLPRFEPYVGVPVQRPVFQPFNANFNGARVHAMRDNRAALLQYTVARKTGERKEHRITVYVFDPRMVSMRPTRLRERVVREPPVYVGTLHGYSIAATTQRGVGYALASDLSDDESTQMVVQAFQQQ